MNNSLFKLFSIALILSFTSTIVQAQQPGKRGGNAANFFATDAFGGQNAHLQQGAFGSFGLNDRWIGIGQPFVPSGAELYGMRVQDRGYTGTFSLNGPPDFKNLEIDWGGADQSRLIFNFIENPFTKYEATSIDKKGGVRTIGRFQAYNGPGGTNNYIEIFYSGNTARLNARNANFLDFQQNNSTKMRLTSSGTLGINVTNPSGFFKLDVGGAARNTTGFWNTSDSRFKKEIQPLSTKSNKLSQLEPVTYKFKQEVIGNIDLTKTEDRVHYGFIAQDLAKVFPELVMQDEFGYYAVRYEGLIPVLVEGYNNQQELIEEQESTISTLNNKVENLEKQMQQILDALASTDNPASLRISPKFSKDNANLQQNRPNPFKGMTTIDYELPANVSNAQLVVLSLDGKLIKSFNVVDRIGSVDFDGSNLTAGTYLYTLVVDGKNLAQQKMIVQ